jgi:integrase
MASLANDPNGRRRLIVQVDGKRQTIRLGRMQRRSAETIRRHVEYLVEHRLSGLALPDDTAAWIGTVDDTLRTKLEKVGLIGPPAAEPERVTTTRLGDFVDEYMEHRKGTVKESTRVHWREVRGRLVGYFGEDRHIDTITVGDVKGFLWDMEQRGKATATIRRTTGVCRQFFSWAVDKGYLETNVFDRKDLPVSVRGNPDRRVFVSLEQSKAALDACPDAQWRLIFALSRWGGLRCPSEVLSLTWADINWAEDRIRVPSPKTAKQGKASRIAPLFPELRGPLMEVYETAEPGTEWVITKYRLSNLNLRTQFHRLLRRAGIEPWAKPFQNLRSTRATELMQEYPDYVVSAWLGHTEKVGEEHYWQVTDEHWAKAAREAARTLQETPGNGLKQKRRHPLTGAPNSSYFNDLRPNSVQDKIRPVGRGGFEPP